MLGDVLIFHARRVGNWGEFTSNEGPNLLLLLVVTYVLYTMIFPYVSEVALYNNFLKVSFLGGFILGVILVVRFRFSGWHLSGEI